VAPACLLLASSLSCGGGDDGREEVIGEGASPIVDGAPSGAEHDASVLVIYDFGEASFIYCGGVLLAPNVLATPRHCITITSEAPYACDAKGEPVADGGGGGYVLEDLEPENIKVYATNLPHSIVEAPPMARGTQIIHDGSQTLCSHDIAFVILDREIDTVPRVQMRLDSQPAFEEAITAVGWGKTDGSNPTLVVGRTFSTNLPIIQVGPMLADPDAEGLEPVPRTFYTGPALCEGDSGSTAFAESGAVLGLGVRALGYDILAPDPCDIATIRSVFMQIAPFKELIVEAFAAAGQELWLEGEPPLGSIEDGEACTAGRLCASGVCGFDEGVEEGICTRACSSDADCSEGSECRASSDGGGTVCMPAPPDDDLPSDPGNGALPGDDESCAMQAGRARSSAGLSLLALAALAALGRRRRAKRAARGLHRAP
jgi:hypothetical protein